jgi:hypothetical protein
VSVNAKPMSAMEWRDALEWRRVLAGTVTALDNEARVAA